MPAIPRPNIVARAERIIKQSGDIPVEETKGFQLQMAQERLEPGSLKMGKRIPHILDLETDKIVSGTPGSYHYEILGEKPSLGRKKTIFIEESPQGIEYRLSPDAKHAGMSENDETIITKLQEKFPDKAVITPSGRLYTTGLEGRLTNILGEEQPEQDIEKRLTSILTEVTVSPVVETDKFTTDSLYKWTELGIKERLQPEEFVNKIVKEDQVEPEFAVNLYNSLVDKETAPLLTPEMAAITPTEAIPFTKIKLDEKTLKEQYKKGEIGLPEVIAKRSMARLLDFVQLAGYGVTGSALSKLVPKTYPSKASVIKPTDKQIISDMKKEGLVNPTKEQQIEYEVTHYYDPDPAMSEQFRNIESMTRMKQLGTEEGVVRDVSKLVEKETQLKKPVTREKQLQGIEKKEVDISAKPFSRQEQLEGLPYKGQVKEGAITEADLGQVITTQLDKNAGKLMALESVKKQMTDQLPPVKPVEQAAKEALDHELLFKNVDELIHHVDNSGWYTNWEKMDGAFRKTMMSSLEAIRRAGPKGEEVYKRFKNWIDIPEVRSARIITRLKPLWDKLSKEEKINAVEVSDAAYYNEVVQPISPKVQQYADELFKSTAAVTDEARNIGLEVAQQTRPFYTHSLADMDKFVKAQPKIAEQLVKNKQAKNMNEALTILNEFRRKYVDQEFQGLEKARTLHIRGYKNLKESGFDTDFTAWENYFMSSLRRIEAIKQFGPKGYEHMYSKIADLSADSRIAGNIAARLFKRMTNRDEKDLEAAFFAKNFSNFNLITLGGQVSLMQLASIPNVYIRSMKLAPLTGLKNATVGFYKGMKSVFSKADKETVEATGAMINNTINDIRTMYGKSWLTEKYFKYSGTNALDWLTRAMAVHAAPHHLKLLTKRLITNPNDKLALREAKMMDIDVPSLVKSKGNLPQNELDLIYKRFSDSTIGRTRPSDLPLWWTSPLGKVISLYRKYAFFQHKFMKDNVWKEIGKGNVPQLLPWLGIQYPVGYLIGEARAKLSDRDRPRGVWKVIDNMAMVQGLGVFLDATMAAIRPVKGMERFLFGVLDELPDLVYYSAGIPVQYLSGQLSHKDFENFKKYWAKKATGGIPIFNKYFFGEMYPETKKVPQVRK